MTKEITTCDICGKVIDPSEKRYKIVSRWNVLCFDERRWVNDMCRDCYADYKKFVKNRLADKANKE